MKFLPRLLSIFAIISLLSGCITYDSNLKAERCFKVVPPDTRRAMLVDLNHWDINGFFTVQFATPTGGLSSVEPNTYAWNYSSLNSYDLEVSSLIKMYTLRFLCRYDYVTLFKNHVFYRAGAPAEVLMAEAVGWSIPIRDLRYWVRGIPANGPFHAVYDQYGLIMTLHQHGWTIRYCGYANVTGYDLPIKFTLEHNGMIVNFVIKDWTLMMLNDSINPAP